VGIVYLILVGVIAGWLAGKIMRGTGFGLVGDLVIGVIGSLLGGFVFGLLGISSYNVIGSIAIATAGAILLLYLIRYVR
jgi:uncharacterized membrane protein YeaQ/YmgE (transglycosylase-associated protein family)